MESFKKSVFCPAKVNLVLKIGERRRDGYHAVATLMTKLDWGDELSAEIEQGSGFDLEIDAPGLEVEKKNNLVYRAAKMFSESIPVLFSAKVKLKKRIPAEAGLAGGSSNAAAMLKLLKEWYLKSLGKNKSLDSNLRKIARDLGSDIEFFMGESSAAWCTGRGERCEQTKLPAWWVVLVHPKQRISTASAYRELAQARKKKKGKGKPDLSPPAWMGKTTALIPDLRNDFEPWALESFPELDKLQKDLCRSGAMAGGMSGSGSSFYGLFADRASAKQAESFLRDQAWNTDLAQVQRTSKGQ